MFSRHLTIAALLLCVSTNLHADEKAAKARLARADAQTRLDDPTLKPWYLKAAIQLYDDAGKPHEQGTLEIWWAGPSLYKRTITSPSYNATFIVNKDGKFQTAGATEAPYLIEMLEREIVHPLHLDTESAGASAELQAPIPNGPPVDCIMLTQPIRNVPFPTPGLFPTYCMDHDKDMLRVAYDYGNFMAARETLTMFQQKVAPVALTISMNRVPAASSTTTALKLAALTDADFAVPATGMEPVDTHPVSVRWNDIRATQAANEPPPYPVTVPLAKFGTPVEVQVRIGTDGRVHDLHLVSTPDASMAAPAMYAVEQWTWDPHKVNGKAVAMETTVPVLFVRRKLQGIMKDPQTNTNQTTTSQPTKKH